MRFLLFLANFFPFIASEAAAADAAITGEFNALHQTDIEQGEQLVQNHNNLMAHQLHVNEALAVVEGRISAIEALAAQLQTQGQGNGGQNNPGPTPPPGATPPPPGLSGDVWPAPPGLVWLRVPADAPVMDGEAIDINGRSLRIPDAPGFVRALVPAV